MPDENEFPPDKRVCEIIADAVTYIADNSTSIEQRNEKLDCIGEVVNDYIVSTQHLNK